MRQIVLDTETTGLHVDNNHRIIEIGCIELINRKITGKRFHTFLNPEREIESGASNVHGITTDFLQDKPLFAHIADELINFIKGAELIIHNAPFDVAFLNYELSLMNHTCQYIHNICRIIDTLEMARQLHIGQRNSLDALCKRYGVDNSQRDLHGALLDADLLCHVYLAMTGGQSSLFDDFNMGVSNIMQSSSSNYAIKKPQDLHVIFASADELSAHATNLQGLSSLGKCLWLETVNPDY